MTARAPVFAILCLLAAGLITARAFAATPMDTDVRPEIRPPVVFGSPPARSAAPTMQPVAGAGTNSRHRSPAQLLLLDAIRALESRDTISARIGHETYLFDKHLIGDGTYLEQRSGGLHLMRLELRIQLGDKSSSLVQVCDGRHFWIYRNLPSDQQLFRIDVDTAARALEQAEATSRPPEIGSLPGLGGLSRVLRGLDGALDFTKIEQGQWGSLKQPVWRLTGQWKRQRLANFLPGQKDAIEKDKPADLSKLPEYLPDQVILLLGQADLFPYRFEYRRATTEKPSPSGEPASRALVTMVFSSVNINVPIEDQTKFVYNPGDLQPIDQTKSFVESLGQKE